jgi:hypothetical protein
MLIIAEQMPSSNTLQDTADTAEQLQLSRYRDTTDTAEQLQLSRYRDTADTAEQIQNKTTIVYAPP